MGLSRKKAVDELTKLFPNARLRDNSNGALGETWELDIENGFMIALCGSWQNLYTLIVTSIWPKNGFTPKTSDRFAMAAYKCIELASDETFDDGPLSKQWILEAVSRNSDKEISFEKDDIAYSAYRVDHDLGEGPVITVQLAIQSKFKPTGRFQQDRPN
jgi:hypothetical protein